MAKRTRKSPGEEIATTPGESPRKLRGGARVRTRREVASEMAAGQDQAAAMSDEFVGIANAGEEPVQAGASASTGSMSMSSEPSAEDVRMRAYHRYLERGGGHGMDFEDWLEAERDLKIRR